MLSEFSIELIEDEAKRCQHIAEIHSKRLECVMFSKSIDDALINQQYVEHYSREARAYVRDLLGIEDDGK